MSSTSKLGGDIVVPGIDVAWAACPAKVVERCWTIAFLFQHWRLDALDVLVEEGRATSQEYEAFVRDTFGCRVDELLLTRARSDVDDVLCQFATADPNESVYDCTIGGLLAANEPYAAAAFISFRLRYDQAGDRLIGLAFDFTYEVT